MQNNTSDYLSNYAAERAAASSNYIVEELEVEEIEYLAAPPDMIEVAPFDNEDAYEPYIQKSYDDRIIYGPDRNAADPFELSLEPCHRAFNNNFTD